jgi:hypothetical protein
MRRAHWERAPFRTSLFKRDTSGKIINDSTGQPIISEPWLSFFGNLAINAGLLEDLEVLQALNRDAYQPADVQLSTPIESSGFEHGKIDNLEARLQALESSAATPLLDQGQNIDRPLGESVKRVFDKIDELSLAVAMVGESRSAAQSGQTIKNIQIPVSAFGKAAAAPADAILGNYLGYEFIALDSVHYNLTNPTDWNLDTDIDVVIYWCIDEGDATKYVAWELYYTVTRPDGTQAVDAASATLPSGDIAIPAVAKLLVKTTFTIPCADIKVGFIAGSIVSVTGIQIARIAAAGAAPAANPILVGGAVRYIADRAGEII